MQTRQSGGELADWILLHRLQVGDVEGGVDVHDLDKVKIAAGLMTMMRAQGCSSGKQSSDRRKVDQDCIQVRQQR